MKEETKTDKGWCTTRQCVETYFIASPHISDLPTIFYSNTATSAIITVGDSVKITTGKLQLALKKVAIWTKNWRVKFDESKWTRTDFTNKQVFMNGGQLLYSNKAKYTCLFSTDENGVNIQYKDTLKTSVTTQHKNNWAICTNISHKINFFLNAPREYIHYPRWGWQEEKLLY